ncbi:MAG: FHA domain-containing protein [Negativicutes bacterium]|nr:FHA domain-containing protein [Negativicutes bacterium]
MPSKMLILNTLGIVLQYGMVVLLYYFLFKVVRLVYCEMVGPGAAGQRVPLPAAPPVQEAPQAKLVVLDAGPVKLSRTEFSLGETISIGRHDGNDIVINDSFVSHEHACITRYKQGFWLTDLHSTNGTSLNNQPVREEVQLKAGDLIRIGAVSFRFER